MAGDAAGGQPALAPPGSAVRAGYGAVPPQGGRVMLCGRTRVSFRVKGMIFASPGLTASTAICFLVPWMGVG